MRAHPVLLALSPLLLPLSPVLDRDETRQDGLEAQVAARAKEAVASGGVAGISVVVQVGDDVAVAEAAGVSGCQPERASADTHYAAGGLLDLLLAASAARLAEDDALDLDAKVASLLDDFPFEADGITVRQLLSHTSGLPSLDDLPAVAAIPADAPAGEDQAAQAPPSPERALLTRLGALPLQATPGTCQRWSGGDVLVLGMVLEAVTGTPVAALVAREVLAPAGTTETDFGGPDRPEPARHVRAMGARWIAPDPQLLPFDADRLRTSARDLARLGRALTAGALASVGETLASATRVDGATQAFAHGVVAGQLDGLDSISFGSATEDCTVHCAVYPDADLTIAVCASPGDAPVEALERWLAREVNGLPQPGIQDLPLPADAEAVYAGEYLVGCNAHIVSVAGERLHLDIPGGPDFDLLNQGRHRFVSALDPDLVLTFELDGGRAVLFYLDDHGVRSVGKRMH